MVSCPSWSVGRCSSLLLRLLSPWVDKPRSVSYGWCDARSTVTFPVAQSVLVPWPVPNYTAWWQAHGTCLEPNRTPTHSTTQSSISISQMSSDVIDMSMKLPNRSYFNILHRVTKGFTFVFTYDFDLCQPIFVIAGRYIPHEICNQLFNEGTFIVFICICCVGWCIDACCWLRPWLHVK